MLRESRVHHHTQLLIESTVPCMCIQQYSYSNFSDCTRVIELGVGALPKWKRGA